MNIIVVGAGNVGYTAAEVLSHFHNVMVIDNNKNVVETVKSLLNVSILFEDGASPKTLEDAFRRHSPDVIISATQRDEDNLFIAMVSKIIDPKTKTIARIRNPDFMVETTENVVDQIISPEVIIANKMAELALLENAVDYESIESMGMGLAFFEVNEEHRDIIGKVVINLKIPEDCTIVSIYRGNEVILNTETVEIHAGDRICVLGSPESIRRFNEMMGVIREASEFIIVGGGVAGVAAKVIGFLHQFLLGVGQGVPAGLGGGAQGVGLFGPLLDLDRGDLLVDRGGGGLVGVLGERDGAHGDDHRQHEQHGKQFLHGVFLLI